MTALQTLAKDIEFCQNCELAKHRTKAVPGEGADDATILFIGEAPGWHEDQQGRPFVGPAGQFLEELLLSVNLKRELVYIANVIKCRPPGNRDPLQGEIEACREWLDLQIQLLSPRIIVTLGRYSMARYFPGETIGKIHGIPRKRDGVIYYPMYHPAAALHQGSLRKIIEADMLKIPELLVQAEQIQRIREQPQQLSMF